MGDINIKQSDLTVEDLARVYEDLYEGDAIASVKDADPEVRFVLRFTHPQSAMMLGFVGSDGKTISPLWFDGSVNATTYKNALVHHVFPILEAPYGSDRYIWTQDEAPAHTSKAIQKYLKNKLGSRGFWSKEMWHPSSLNLNPLDFSIWKHVESRACAIYHSNISNLKAAVDQVWMKKSCSTCRKCLNLCIAAEGSVFKKKHRIWFSLQLSLV